MWLTFLTVLWIFCLSNLIVSSCWKIITHKMLVPLNLNKTFFSKTASGHSWFATSSLHKYENFYMKMKWKPASSKFNHQYPEQLDFVSLIGAYSINKHESACEYSRVYIIYMEMILFALTITATIICVDKKEVTEIHDETISKLFENSLLFQRW